MKDVLEAIEKAGFNNYKQKIDDFLLQIEKDSVAKPSIKRKPPEDNNSKMEDEIGKKVFKVDSPLKDISPAHESLTVPENRSDIKDGQKMEIDDNIKNKNN